MQCPCRSETELTSAASEGAFATPPLPRFLAADLGVAAFCLDRGEDFASPRLRDADRDREAEADRTYPSPDPRTGVADLPDRDICPKFHLNSVVQRLLSLAYYA
jgi:hypothetical protein